jgi:DNA polymerase I-like protein with 3'-5' exonuclease and polymerase domains
VKLDRVERLVAGYFSKFADTSKWRLSSVAGARANRQVRTKIGPRIHIPDNATDTSPFCLPVQTTGADAFKLAMCLFSRGLEGVDAVLWIPLHDEIVVEAREGIEDQVQTIVKESMVEALKRIIPEIPFVAEAWG